MVLSKNKELNTLLKSASKELGLTQKQIKECLNDLRDMGLIEESKNNFKVNPITQDMI